MNFGTQRRGRGTTGRFPTKSFQPIIPTNPFPVLFTTRSSSSLLKQLQEEGCKKKQKIEFYSILCKRFSTLKSMWDGLVMERIRNEARWRILWRRSILSILENIVQTFNLEHIGAFCADACNVKSDYFASIIFLMPG